MQTVDVVVLGAGASGMMCAMTAAQRARRVVLLEHAPLLGRKIRLSGGGRCNFTNLGAGPERYVSANPHFACSALARYTPEHFLQLVRAHGIAYHEKTLGQLFCDGSAQQIIDMLAEECRNAGVATLLGCRIQAVEKGELFVVTTNQGVFASTSLVVATGGLSLPKVGATDFGYRLARQFGLQVTKTAPALDAFVFAQAQQRQFADLAGVSLPAAVHAQGPVFHEQVLFTHTGLSGPAALQASLYWHPKEAVHVDLLPQQTFEQARDWLWAMKMSRPRAEVKTVLAEQLPRRAADRFCAMARVPEKPLSQQTRTTLEAICRQLKNWTFIPKSTVGYRTAEVTRGGVDTRELSSKTMQVKKVPGLYFIGEVVDVTGRLGGYNFQWAWASGWVAGHAV